MPAGPRAHVETAQEGRAAAPRHLPEEQGHVVIGQAAQDLGIVEAAKGLVPQRDLLPAVLQGGLALLAGDEGPGGLGVVVGQAAHQVLKGGFQRVAGPALQKIVQRHGFLAIGLERDAGI